MTQSDPNGVQGNMSNPKREQIADRIADVETWVKIGDTDRDQIADAVIPLIQQAVAEAYERAAMIAAQDAMSVTLLSFDQFPVVQSTGSRIAFNIRAAALKETR